MTIPARRNRAASSIAVREKRAVASISARVRKAHVPVTRAQMIASLSVAVTVRYLPRPAQQASAPQIGVEAADVDPAGSQQQQLLQSVHDATCGSAWHTALHDEASPPLVDIAASGASVEASVGSVAPLPPLEEPVASALFGCAASFSRG
jgi:hypothetical protein